jgi:hypothetical protein
LAIVENDGLCNEENKIHMKEERPFMKDRPETDDSGDPDGH